MLSGQVVQRRQLFDDQDVPKTKLCSTAFKRVKDLMYIRREILTRVLTMPGDSVATDGA